MFGFLDENLCTVDDDQTDFYNFALRKFSIIQFIDMVRFNQSNIRSDKRYVKGLTSFLKNAVVYERHKILEDEAMAKKLEGLNKANRNKVLKAREEELADNTVALTSQEMKELDIRGDDFMEKKFNIK